MSQMPVFAAAPRLKLYIQNKPVAFAVGLNLNVSVEIQDVYVIGQYAPVTNEPLMYNLVTGTMQIMRLVPQTTQNTLNALADAQVQMTNQSARRAVADFANTAQGGEVTAASGTDNDILTNALLDSHLDPAQVLLSQAFNMRMFMKVPRISGGSPDPASPLVEKEWMEIQGCRITSENINIAMGQITNVPLNFQGLLVTSSIPGIEKFQRDSLVKQGTVNA